VCRTIAREAQRLAQVAIDILRLLDCCAAIAQGMAFLPCPTVELAIWPEYYSVSVVRGVLPNHSGCTWRS
jgi:hypothetical protein